MLSAAEWLSGYLSSIQTACLLSCEYMAVPFSLQELMWDRNVMLLLRPQQTAGLLWDGILHFSCVTGFLSQKGKVLWACVPIGMVVHIDSLLLIISVCIHFQHLLEFTCILRNNYNGQCTYIISWERLGALYFIKASTTETEL